jgi:glycosyltransferase involved in cell wall biosynthesis
MLLDAFARVARVDGSADLLLAGDGPQRQDLEAQAAALGIQRRVRFLGVRGDVPDLLRAADIFTLTSVSEAASLTLMEAMAAGLPVVVTNVGGNPEIVRQGVDGLLVPRGDSAAAADAFLALLADAENARLMGQAARARAHERYRLDRTVSDYYERYAAAAQAVRTARGA